RAARDRAGRRGARPRRGRRARAAARSRSGPARLRVVRVHALRRRRRLSARAGDVPAPRPPRRRRPGAARPRAPRHRELRPRARHARGDARAARAHAAGGRLALPHRGRRRRDRARARRVRSGRAGAGRRERPRERRAAPPAQGVPGRRERRGPQHLQRRLPVGGAARGGRAHRAARRPARGGGGAVTSSGLFAPAPVLESHSDLYGPFAAAVEALRAVSCDGLARVARRTETADPDDSLQAAASRMGWRKVGVLGVVRDGRLVGALSEDDLLRATAQRLGELSALVANVGDAMVVWQDLLGGLQVHDVMTPASELVIVGPGLDMVSGLARICAATRHGTRFRYLWIVGDDGAVLRVVSIRDMARGLTRLYDGDFPAEGFRNPAVADDVRYVVAALLDLSIGA